MVTVVTIVERNGWPLLMSSDQKELKILLFSPSSSLGSNFFFEFSLTSIPMSEFEKVHNFFFQSPFEIRKLLLGYITVCSTHCVLEYIRHTPCTMCTAHTIVFGKLFCPLYTDIIYGQFLDRKLYLS